MRDDTTYTNTPYMQDSPDGADRDIGAYYEAMDIAQEGKEYEEIYSDYIDDNGDHVFRGELRKRKDADTLHNTDGQSKDIQQADCI